MRRDGGACVAASTSSAWLGGRVLQARAPPARRRAREARGPGPQVQRRAAWRTGGSCSACVSAPRAAGSLTRRRARVRPPPRSRGHTVCSKAPAGGARLVVGFAAHNQKLALAPAAARASGGARKRRRARGSADQTQRAGAMQCRTQRGARSFGRKRQRNHHSSLVRRDFDAAGGNTCITRAALAALSKRSLTARIDLTSTTTATG